MPVLLRQANPPIESLWIQCLFVIYHHSPGTFEHKSALEVINLYIMLSCPGKLESFLHVHSLSDVRTETQYHGKLPLQCVCGFPSENGLEVYQLLIP